MKQIRNNIFETNSSSSHCFNLYTDGDVDENKDPHITFGCYDTQEVTLDTLEDKLDYAFVCTCYDGRARDIIENRKNYIVFKNLINSCIDLIDSYGVTIHFKKGLYFEDSNDEQDKVFGDVEISDLGGVDKYFYETITSLSEENVSELNNETFVKALFLMISVGVNSSWSYVDHADDYLDEVNEMVSNTSYLRNKESTIFLGGCH